MTIKKDHFPQHGRWLIRYRMSESGVKLNSLTLIPTVVAKQRRKRYKVALDMRERPACYWQSVFFANETMITDNFFNPKQKFICGAWFPELTSSLVRIVTRPSMKLCQFALRHGQPMRWWLIEGILNSSTFVRTINEFFHERTHKKFYRVRDSCTR